MDPVGSRVGVERTRIVVVDQEITLDGAWPTDADHGSVVAAAAAFLD